MASKSIALMYRITLLCAVVPLCTALAVHGQVFEPHPDTLDARGYIPLQVGNVWEYSHYLHRPLTVFRPTNESETRYERYRLTDSLVVQDTTYFTLLIEYHDSSRRLTRSDTAQVGYDESTASLLATGDPGIFQVIRCLDADFGRLAHDSRDCGFSWVAEDSSNTSTILEGEHVRIKTFASFVWGHAVVHGVGLLGYGGGCEPCGVFDDADYWTLEFAQVNGNVYGSAVVGLPSESQARLPTDRTLAAWPNPARDVLHTQVQPYATVMLYDILGRQQLRTVASGSGTVQLDVSDKPPGVYVLQSGSHSSRVVIQ